MSFSVRRMGSSVPRIIWVRPHKIFDADAYPPAPPPPWLGLPPKRVATEKPVCPQNNLPRDISYPLRPTGSSIQRIIWVRPHKIFDADAHPPAPPPPWERLLPSRMPASQSIDVTKTKEDQVIVPRSPHGTPQDALTSFHGADKMYGSHERIVSQDTPSHPAACTSTRQSINWEESKADQSDIRGSLQRMQSALRTVHKHKIPWPDAGGVSHDSLEGYLRYLLQPVANIFNELRSHRILREMPLEYVGLDLGDSMPAATFTMSDKEKKRFGVSIPMVIALPDDIFDPSGKITDRVEHAVGLGLAHESSPRLILATNFRDIVAFFPAQPGHPSNSFTRVPTTFPALALRAICAAFIYDCNALGCLVNIPDPGLVPDIDPDDILPEGPPQDPGRPLPPDEEIFRTHRRFSDFDKVTLVRDPARALQFFRWHAFMRSNYPKVVLSPGDIVTANGSIASKITEGRKPLYSFDWADLPPDTTAHVRAIQRNCVVEDAGLADALRGSKSFRLKITDVVSKGTDRSCATLYRCEFASIDNNPVSVSVPLCLKLFDDRSMKLSYPGGDHGELEDEPLHRWFDRVTPVEDMVLSEHHAYEKLHPVQGTVVPRYYGVYEFALPDETTLYGILMEYISGNPVSPDFIRTLGSEREISMIKSCRHATRVLDVADISQVDWHSGQIMLCTNTETDIDHCVFVDFGITRTTWSADEPLMLQNYSGCRYAISTEAKGKLFDKRLVRDYFGVPDDWDSIYVISKSPMTGKSEVLHAKSPFTYISLPTFEPT